MKEREGLSTHIWPQPPYYVARDVIPLRERDYSTLGCRHSTATLAGWLARRALAHPPVPYPSRPGRTDNIGDSKTKNPVGKG